MIRWFQMTDRVVRSLITWPHYPYGQRHKPREEAHSLSIQGACLTLFYLSLSLSLSLSICIHYHIILRLTLALECLLYNVVRGPCT